MAVRLETKSAKGEMKEQILGWRKWAHILSNKVRYLSNKVRTCIYVPCMYMYHTAVFILSKFCSAPLVYED